MERITPKEVTSMMQAVAQVYEQPEQSEDNTILEFENIEDLFMYMSAAAPPMKNTIPINSYKGNIMSFIPLSPSTGESYLMLYAKGELEAGIYEFDVSSKSYKKVESVERADKVYFISLTPKRNTIADKALQSL